MSRLVLPRTSLRRRTGRLAVAVTHVRGPAVCGRLTALALFASGGRAFACPSCFGQAQGPLIDAARLGIWLLLALTLCLQGAFAAFFLYLRRRAASCVDQPPDEQWSRLCREGDRTGRSA